MIAAGTGPVWERLGWTDNPFVPRESEHQHPGEGQDDDGGHEDDGGQEDDGQEDEAK